MIVFISMPSKGLFHLDDTTKRWFMHDRVRVILADLHRERPDDVFIAPSIQNYNILPFMGDEVGSTYQSWQDRCRQLIEMSDLVIVLKSPHWDESVGVKDEIFYANQMDIPIQYREWVD